MIFVYFILNTLGLLSFTLTSIGICYLGVMVIGLWDCKYSYKLHEEEIHSVSFITLIFQLFYIIIQLIERLLNVR